MIKRILVIVITVCVACQFAASQTTLSLKEIFKNDFLIGTAMDVQQIEERNTVADALIKQQFNAATPENTMKAEIIHSAWNTNNF